MEQIGNGMEPEQAPNSNIKSRKTSHPKTAADRFAQYFGTTQTNNFVIPDVTTVIPLLPTRRANVTRARESPAVTHPI